jgi:glycosyltransferase involved in cell wall biosynthesis
MTLNEERNIEFCLRSVRPWCDEVVVADNYSDDRTPEIARRFADTFMSNERIEGFDAGRQKAFEAATGDWILSIDADEVVTPQLATWIRDFVDSDPPYDVVLVPRANVFLGRWIRSSPWWPGKPRLFRRGKIEVTAKLHSGLVPVEGARIGRIPRDENLSLWHFALPSVATMVEKTNRYTTIEGRQGLEGGRGSPGALELIARPLRALAPYIVRRGYRDGMAGLAYTVDRMYYSFLSAMKRWDESNAPMRMEQYDQMREEIVSGFSSFPSISEKAEPEVATADR